MLVRPLLRKWTFHPDPNMIQGSNFSWLGLMGATVAFSLQNSKSYFLTNLRNVVIFGQAPLRLRANPQFLGQLYCQRQGFKVHESFTCRMHNAEQRKEVHAWMRTSKSATCSNETLSYDTCTRYNQWLQVREIYKITSKYLIGKWLHQNLKNRRLETGAACGEALLVRR